MNTETEQITIERDEILATILKEQGSHPRTRVWAANELRMLEIRLNAEHRDDPKVNEVRDAEIARIRDEYKAMHLMHREEDRQQAAREQAMQARAQQQLQNEALASMSDRQLTEGIFLAMQESATALQAIQKSLSGKAVEEDDDEETYGPPDIADKAVARQLKKFSPKIRAQMKRILSNGAQKNNA